MADESKKEGALRGAPSEGPGGPDSEHTPSTPAGSGPVKESADTESTAQSAPAGSVGDAQEQAAPEPAPEEAAAQSAPAEEESSAAPASEQQSGEQAEAEQPAAEPAAAADPKAVVPPEDVEARAAKADEYLAMAQRTRADFDNYRKRAARDAALAQVRGVSKLAKELLPSIDNLDRALQAAEQENEAGGHLADGVRMVRTELLAALNRAGIERYSPDGQKFDPTVHEAVAQIPREGVESGQVLEVYQQGFKLGETVLRPARVLVAQ